MKKALLFIALTIAAFFAVQAQELQVREFEHDPFNTYASYHQKLDYSGDPCGVILLSLPDPNTKFEGSIMYDYLTYDHGEWVIYMTKGAKYLTIKTEKYAPVRYDFPEGLAIQGNVTYIMVVIPVPLEPSLEEMIERLKKAGYNISKSDIASNNSDESAMVTQGDSCYDAKNYKEAAKCYRQAAYQDDAKGQFNLGVMYYNGYGVGQDKEMAEAWFSKAANTIEQESGETTKSVSMPIEEKEEDSFMFVEQMPSYPGGRDKMIEFIAQTIKYPKDAREQGIQGRVYVNFKIEPNGSLSHVRVLNGIGGGCEEEAMRVVKSMPNWNPGIHRGKAVRMSYTIPFDFKL